MALALLALLALSSSLASGCGEGAPPEPAILDAGVAPRIGRLARPVAFEGHSGFVNELRAEGLEVDLRGALVRIEPSDALELQRVECTRARCALLLRVHDTRPSRGIPIPAPIDARNVTIEAQTLAGERVIGTLSVLPLDEIVGGPGASARIGGGWMLASSASAPLDSTFLASAGAEPIRWFVFGDVNLAAEVDLRAEGLEGRAGGASAPAAASRASSAAGAGGAGQAGAGGGGGGHRGLGVAGQGSDGVDGGGGVGGLEAHDPALSCLSDAGLGGCGGGAGGASELGAGGAGGGAMLLVSLGRMELGGARFWGSGGAGAVGGGGGGAGGALLFAASEWLAPEAIDLSGGAGGAAPPGGGAGGAGSEGRVRIDILGEPEGSPHGPIPDLRAFDPFVRSPSFLLEGRAEPGARLEIARVGEPSIASGDVGPDGRFALEVPLVAGMNRLALRSSGAWGEARGWTGNGVEMVSAGGSSHPAGATVDLVYLPADEL